MTILNVADSARLAGVEPAVIHEQIKIGVISKTAQGIDLSELIRVYPELKPLASLKIRQVKKSSVISEDSLSTVPSAANSAANSDNNTDSSSETVALLQRELEWNKALLEQTNQRLTQQIEEQRKLIRDQARRLDEKDQFWSKQVAQAQALLPSPESMKRKKFLGIF
jgi:hypothetical protein